MGECDQCGADPGYEYDRAVLCRQCIDAKEAERFHSARKMFDGRQLRMNTRPPEQILELDAAAMMRGLLAREEVTIEAGRQYVVTVQIEEVD